MTRAPKAIRGQILLIVLVLSLALSALLTTMLLSPGQALSQHARTQSTLLEAREALLGFAMTYREAHPDQLGQYSEGYGYLPCPDFNNDGIADPPCGASDVSQIGRLPWQTLGLPALRDAAGECLWYAVSGRGKDNPKTSMLNWDSTSQLLLSNTEGQLLSPSGPHGGTYAVVLAANAPLDGQIRPQSGTGECPGDNLPLHYLEGTDPIYQRQAPVAGNWSKLQLRSPTASGNNDEGLSISLEEIFIRISQRADFKSDIDNLLGQLANCLNKLPPAALPPASADQKGMTQVLAQCPLSQARLRRMLDNWHDNLLYTRPTGNLVVNGHNCQAVLIFGGARTVGQRRSTPAEIDTAANYLEGGNRQTFPGAGAYTGPAGFSAATPDADILRCITGLPSGATQVSFDADLSAFRLAGQGASIQDSQTALQVSAAGSTGGCLWFSAPLPLAGKTLNAAFSFQFGSSDEFALTQTGSDRGYGFTLQLLRTDWGSPETYCGRSIDMGSLGLNSSFAAGTLGLISLILEHDIYRQSSNNDTTANHVATLLNGNLTHSSTNGAISRNCNGSAAGCELAPGNLMEDTPTPKVHVSRVEMISGCNSNCSHCQPNQHAAPNDYIRIRTWLDCSECQDVTAAPLATAITASCPRLDPRMNTVYFGLTAGLRSGSNQTLNIRDFVIRSE